MSNTKDWPKPNENDEIDAVKIAFDKWYNTQGWDQWDYEMQQFSAEFVMEFAEQYAASRISELEAENKRLREEIENQQIEIVKKDEQLDSHRWIPVTERLPETSMWVLCICSEERHWLAFRALNGWYIDTSFGQKFVGDQDETKHIKIQHWQPLTFPQPPKEQ